MPPDITSPYGNGPGSLETPVPNGNPAAPEPPKGQLSMGPATITNGVQGATGATGSGSPDLSGAADPSLVSGYLNRLQNPSSAPPIQGGDSSQPGAPGAPGMASGQSAAATPLDILKMASLARSDSDRLAIYQHVFGQGNALNRDGTIYVRKPGETNFAPAEPTFSDLKDHLLNLQFSQAANDAMGLYAKNATGINDGVVQMAAGTAGAMAGDLLGGPVGGAAGGAYLSAEAARSQSLKRTSAINDLLGRKTDPAAAEALANDDFTTTLIANGTISLGMAGVSKLAGVTKDMIANMPYNRVLSIAKLNQEIADFASSFGGKAASSAASAELAPATADALTPALAKGGASVMGALEKVGDSSALYNKYLAKWEAVAGDYLDTTNSRVNVMPVLKRIQDLTKEYVTYDGIKPVAVRGSPYQATAASSVLGGTPFDELMDNLSPGQMSQLQAASRGTGAISEDIQELLNGPQSGIDRLFRGEAPFGSPTGIKTLNNIMTTYDYLLNAQFKQGGLAYGEFQDLQQAFGQMGNYEGYANKFYAKTDQAKFQQINGSFIEARDQLYQQVLGGADSPLYKSYAQDYANYGKDKDAVSELFKLFKGDNLAPSLVMDKALATNDPKPIQNLKILFGDNPEMMTQLKTGFVQSILRDAGETNQGLLNTSRFFDLVGDRSKSGVAQEILSQPEARMLQTFANRAGKIPTADLQSPAAQGIVKDGISMMLYASGKNMGNGMLARNLYSMLGQNAKAYDFMMNTDLPQRLAIAKAGGDFGAINKIAGLMETLSNYRMLSTTIKVGSREVIAPLPALKQVFTSLVQSNRNAAINTPAQTARPALH